MKDLILKDLTTQIKYLGFLILLYFLFMILGINGGILFYVGILMIAMRTAYLEEKNNTFVLLKTMPLKSSTVVFSKYWTQLIVMSIFLLCSAIACLLGLGKGQEDFFALVLSLPVMLIFVGLFYMIFFKVGYLKASNYSRIIMLIAFLLLVFPPISTRLISLLILIESFLPIIALSLILVYLGTAIVSIRFFNRREDY